jgi:hypothetical protein
MKKLKRGIAVITLGSTLLFGTGSMVQVKADTSGGPQGTSASKSGGPSSSSGTMTDAEWAYFLWLLLMWLIWGGM